MVFDNKKVVFKINRIRYILLLGFISVMGVIIFSSFFDEPLLGLKKSVYIILFSLAYVVYIVIKYHLNYNYFYYNDDTNKLIFRYISLRPFNDKRNAIEINKKDFKGYKISNSFFNLKEDLTLRVRTSRGVANYPSISITALSAKQKTRLKNALNQFVKS